MTTRHQQPDSADERKPAGSPASDWKGGWQPGTDPERRDYASLADFADPDGNTWAIQEIGYRPPHSAGGGQRLDR